jgi:hypothetical protein
MGSKVTTHFFFFLICCRSYFFIRKQFFEVQAYIKILDFGKFAGHYCNSSASNVLLSNTSQSAVKSLQQSTADLLFCNFSNKYVLEPTVAHWYTSTCSKSNHDRESIINFFSNSKTENNIIILSF